MLSEVDKWSQKYMVYRKGAAFFIILLIISVFVFFTNLSVIKVSTICIISCFICVMAIRWCLDKMDEFKSLYVNTVPMIDPEKDFAEEKSQTDLSEESLVEEIMESFVEEDSLVEDKLEVVSVDEMDVNDLNEDLEQVITEEKLETISVQEIVSNDSNESELPNESISSLSMEEQIVELVGRLIQTKYPLNNELTFKTVGNYFTIYSSKKVLMRLKLTGRKQYVLTYLTKEEVEALGYEWEAPSKSEAYESRIKYTGLEVLEGLEVHICDLYKRCHKL